MSSSLETLLERYAYSGIDPLEDWSTEDLAELETMVNAELQDRSLRDSGHSAGTYPLGCDCYGCRFVRGDAVDD